MIQIETQPLSLKPIPKDFQLPSEGAAAYLEHFKQGKTISQTVSILLGQGRLVSFTQMLDLVVCLHRKNLIQNPMFRSFFEKLETHAKPAGKVALLASLFKKEKPDEYLSRHPFFRSQPPPITALFCRQAEVLEAKPGTFLCQRGHLERDLFFMVEGEAGIYRSTENGGRKLIGFFGKDAVIGEVGFFMGEVRTADVVVTKPSKIVAVRYSPEAFDQTMDREIAKTMQLRLRVVHALAKSPFLKSIPEEAMNSLIFSGKLREVKEFEVLCKEGEKGDSCFVVINGSVAVSKGPKTIGVLGPGEAFGEIALFFTQGTRTATVMAQRETSVLEIHAADFYRLLAENLLLASEFEKLALIRSEKLKKSA